MTNPASYRLIPSLKLTWLMMALAGWSPAYGQPVLGWADWPIGQVVLQSGGELTGKLAYHQAREVVLLRTDSGFKAFSAQQVRSFRFTQQSVGILRRFVAYPFDRGASSERVRFLEVILTGPLYVLRRDTNPQDSLQRLPSNQAALTYDYLTDFCYYVYHQGRLLEMAKFRKAILPLLLEKYPREFSELLKGHHPTHLTLAVQIRLVNAYNNLESQHKPLPATDSEGLPITRNGPFPDSMAK